MQIRHRAHKYAARSLPFQRLLKNLLIESEGIGAWFILRPAHPDVHALGVAVPAPLADVRAVPEARGAAYRIPASVRPFYFCFITHLFPLLPQINYPFGVGGL